MHSNRVWGIVSQPFRKLLWAPVAWCLPAAPALPRCLRSDHPDCSATPEALSAASAVALPQITSFLLRTRFPITHLPALSVDLTSTYPPFPIQFSQFPSELHSSLDNQSFIQLILLQILQIHSMCFDSIVIFFFSFSICRSEQPRRWNKSINSLSGHSGVCSHSHEPCPLTPVPSHFCFGRLPISFPALLHLALLLTHSGFLKCC